MRTNAITLYVAIFLGALAFSIQQSDIYKLQLENKNMKTDILNLRNKETTDTEYLQEKWYELDRKISYK